MACYHGYLFRTFNQRSIGLMLSSDKLIKKVYLLPVQQWKTRATMLNPNQRGMLRQYCSEQSWGNVVKSARFCSSSTASRNLGDSSCESLYNTGVSKINAGDVQQGFNLFLRASRLGFAPAQVALGQLYLEGNPNDKNIEQQEHSSPSTSMIDAAGKPTGGAASAEEVLSELKQSRKENIRRRNEKLREKNHNVQKTRRKIRAENDQERKLVKITRYEADRTSPKEGQLTLEKNEDEAIRWFTRAANQGSTDGMVQLGNILLQRVEAEKREFKKKDVREKLKEALDWYEKAALHDPPHPDALYNLGLLYYEGFHDSLVTDPARSFLLIKQAADVCSDPSALFFVGHIGLQGDEKIPKRLIPDDDNYSWHCLKKAADQGHLGAMTYIFKFLLEDGNADRVNLSAEQAEELAVEYLEKAVQGGDAEAIHIKADMAFGIDNPKALRLYIEAGEAGSAEAWVSAGVMFYQGLGTEISYVSAYRAYEQAAQLGSIEAWKNLASLYYNGQGVVKCIETADKIVQFLNEIDDPVDSN